MSLSYHSPVELEATGVARLWVVGLHALRPWKHGKAHAYANACGAKQPMDEIGVAWLAQYAG